MFCWPCSRSPVFRWAWYVLTCLSNERGFLNFLSIFFAFTYLLYSISDILRYLPIWRKMIGKNFRINKMSKNMNWYLLKILFGSSPSVLLEGWNRSADQFYIQNSLKKYYQWYMLKSTRGLKLVKLSYWVHADHMYLQNCDWILTPHVYPVGLCIWLCGNQFYM